MKTLFVINREVRRVPKNWQHPVDGKGNYIPLFGSSVSEAQRRWEKHNAKWKEGLRQSDRGSSWVAVEEEYKNLTFADWDGYRPKPCEYMPDWTEEERTHYQLYETTTEGTPISPVFSSPEELAQWLTVTKASLFGDTTADYNTWLSICSGHQVFSH